MVSLTHIHILSHIFSHTFFLSYTHTQTHCSSHYFTSSRITGFKNSTSWCLYFYLGCKWFWFFKSMKKLYRTDLNNKNNASPCVGQSFWDRQKEDYDSARWVLVWRKHQPSALPSLMENSFAIPFTIQVHVSNVTHLKEKQTISGCYPVQQEWSDFFPFPCSSI